MIWELHKDGCEYLYEGHTCLGSVDILDHENFLGWHSNWTCCLVFKTKLEAKVWVEERVKENKNEHAT